MMTPGALYFGRRSTHFGDKIITQLDQALKIELLFLQQIKELRLAGFALDQFVFEIDFLLAASGLGLVFFGTRDGWGRWHIGRHLSVGGIFLGLGVDRSRANHGRDDCGNAQPSVKSPSLKFTLQLHS
jgi:hypothetical protein